MGLTTIVVPTWNHADLLDACLAAVRATTDAPIVVSDDGSTDDTAEVAAKHGAQLVTSEVNTGFSGACNRGARVVKTPAVCFLNNDTEPQGDWLAQMEAHLQAGIVGCRLLTAKGKLQHAGIEVSKVRFEMRKNGHPHTEYVPCLPKEIRTERGSGFVDAVTGACMLVDRGLFWQLGGFDEGYRNGYEDVALCLAARHAGSHCWYEAGATVLHRGSQSGGERFRYQRQNERRLSAQCLERSLAS